MSNAEVPQSISKDEFKNAIFKKLDTFKAQLHSKSEQHFILAGRLIHCHLLLENLIVDYIKFKNPNIGCIEKCTAGGGLESMS